MKLKIIIIVFFLAVSLSWSQEKKVFSLNQAIAYALENNRSIKNADRDIKIAKHKKWETTATGLPQLNAKIDYQNWLKQQVSLIPAEFFGGMPGQFAEVTFGTKQSLNANATISQLLFDGSYLVGLQAAKVYLEITKNAKEKTALEIKNAVINAYGNVLLANESINIIKKNKKTLEKTLFETQKIYENGLTEQENVEQLQITLASLKNALLNAQRLENLSKKMLNINLGIDLNKNITLTDTLENLATQQMDFSIVTKENNVEENINYKIAKNDLKSKELFVKLSKAKALPSLNAFLNAGYAGYGETFSFHKKDQRWFGSSLFGIGINIPLFSAGGRNAATNQAKINLEKAKENLSETSQQLKLQYEAAKSDYLFAIEKYTTAKENLALSERIEKKNEIKYFEGIASSFDLRQSQTQLYKIQQEYLQAMLSVITTKAALEKLTNN